MSQTIFLCHVFSSKQYVARDENEGGCHKLYVNTVREGYNAIYALALHINIQVHVLSRMQSDSPTITITLYHIVTIQSLYLHLQL